jgi:hypothetical protein
MSYAYAPVNEYTNIMSNRHKNRVICGGPFYNSLAKKEIWGTIYVCGRGIMTQIRQT